jgi:Cu-Zn family superoxide dismutase
VHQNASCEPGEKEGKKAAAIAAGDHLDPAKAGKHEGPYGMGHLGDLPALYVDASGKAALPVLAPHVKLADFKGHALMVHAGGDNYSDSPEKLGGGGARIACGTIQ